MNYSSVFLLLSFAGLSLLTGAAQADADADAFLGQLHTPTEQALGRGRSAIWTMPLVAVQYQPLQPTLAQQAALQAQREGRFLDALIALDSKDAGAQLSADAEAETTLLRASFLLQGDQSEQVVQMLAPLQASPRYAADAYALTAMAYLQRGNTQQALDAAQRAHDTAGRVLPQLALSYALQGAGRLAQASQSLHDYNARAPQSAITLAREAELALTLDQPRIAGRLVEQARAVDASHPYVIAVSGLVYLIDGQALAAKAAFTAALNSDPKDAKALLGLGLAEIKQGNFQAGQEKLQAANEAEPGNALILTYLGRSQQNLGQTGAAKASWRSAQLADPKDPVPWLYQAQAELQANHPLAARENLREAQARAGYRSVYRGERLLREDKQILQTNLAEIQRQLGLENLAFHTLSDTAGENNSAHSRNRAELLQGRRFGESARRSLLLQSLFKEQPGAIPAALDLYGDGAGQTGAANPQHGVVSALGAQQASYNNYDGLFNRRALLEADATGGSQNTSGAQVRAGVGSDTLGIGVAGLNFKNDGYAAFENLDNRVAHAVVQWRPLPSTQVFVSQQTFNSHWGALFYPAQAYAFYDAIMDDSKITRLGLRHKLTEDGSSELRLLSSQQQTNQTLDTYSFAAPPVYGYSQTGNSHTRSAEVQYRRSAAGYTSLWGIQHARGQINYLGVGDNTVNMAQVYAAWQQTLSPYWQLDANLGWGKIDNRDNFGGRAGTYLQRWLPKLGVVYTPEQGTHLRLAAWQGMSAPGVGDATLAPVSLAGVLLARPGDNSLSGKLVQAVAVSGDRQLSSTWLLDVSTQQRRTELPGTDYYSGLQVLFRQNIDESRLALHWQPTAQPWAVNFACDYERLQNDPTIAALDSVDAQKLISQQVAMRWFANAQWTVNLVWSHNQVSGSQQLIDPNTGSPLYPAYQSRFNQLEADMTWHFIGAGDFIAGVRNATDTNFQYTEIDPLNPRFSKGRMVYGKVKLAW